MCLGVTGHREGNEAFAANRERIESVLHEVLDLIAAAVATESASRPAGEIGQTRMHSLLAEGADHMAADYALAHDWELVSPLPFGLNLNVAINAGPATVEDARAMIAGKEPVSVNVRRRAAAIHALAARARLFELADRDDAIARMFLASLQNPDDPRRSANFSGESSLRAALAAKVMIQQSDIIVAIWDGVTHTLVGGTGHTIQASLEMGAPVVWIDANAPNGWRILNGPEALATIHTPAPAGAQPAAELQALVRTALRPAEARRGAHRHSTPYTPAALANEQWRSKSNVAWHGYRRVEALFGADTMRQRFRNLRQTYETPDAIATGSAAELLASARDLPGQDETFVARIERFILRRFAWSDGISARLSDTYRGGMVASFMLAPMAIIGGIAYLPFATSKQKWMFAGFELAVLAAILAITIIGQQRRWHGRWFETRRVAEYLRHAPILLLLGVARPPGRWPRGSETSWPEWYGRNSLREAGLPAVVITPAYLRRALTQLLDLHVVRQRDYHIYKARRLAAAHHNLDKLSEVMFTLAVVSVTAYLVLKGGGILHIWPKAFSENFSYLFTFLGVALPTLGGAVAGIRYFGDFERFSAISEVTAEKLNGVHMRIQQLLASPDSLLDYGRVSDLALATDDITVSEIESWQAVFGGKHVTVPV